MKNSPSLGLQPLNNCVLVELEQKFKQFNVSESKYDSRTEGIVISVPVAPLEGNKVVKKFQEDGKFPERGLGVLMISHLVGKRVFFEEFEEGGRVERDGKVYGFIKIDSIRGYEDVE